jgi:hypothetical protein
MHSRINRFHCIQQNRQAPLQLLPISIDQLQRPLLGPPSFAIFHRVLPFQSESLNYGTHMHRQRLLDHWIQSVRYELRCQQPVLLIRLQRPTCVCPANTGILNLSGTFNLQAQTFQAQLATSHYMVYRHLAYEFLTWNRRLCTTAYSCNHNFNADMSSNTIPF